MEWYECPRFPQSVFARDFRKTVVYKMPRVPTSPAALQNKERYTGNCEDFVRMNPTLAALYEPSRTRRHRVLHVRVSRSEMERLTQRMAERDYQSISAYLRDAALGRLSKKLVE